MWAVRQFARPAVTMGHAAPSAPLLRRRRVYYHHGMGAREMSCAVGTVHLMMQSRIAWWLQLLLLCACTGFLGLLMIDDS